MYTFLESQSLWINGLIGLAALALLVASADYAVQKLIGLSDYFNISATFMGMTVVSLATSIPEIIAHLTASVGILRGTINYEIGSAIVLGANIGSDVVQQTLIMGIVALMAGGLYFRRYFLWKSMLPMIGTTVMCIVLGLDRHYSRLDGVILFGTFVLYTYYLHWDEKKYYKKVAQEQESQSRPAPETGWQAAGYALKVILAMTVTLFGAQIVLWITQLTVERTGIGGSFIGVVTLGVACALPELVVSISSVRNHDHGISLGTLVGSNITNPLVAIGGGALVSTYWVPRPLIAWDLPWETVTGLILWGMLWFRKGRLRRWSAYYLIGLYVLYVGLRAVFFIGDH